MGHRDRSRSPSPGPVMRARSLSPRVPYLYPDKENQEIENKYRKGWYRVDYGGSEGSELWYLPRFSDRIKFLEYNVDKSKGYPRAMSQPPYSVSTRTVDKPRPSTPTFYAWSQPLPDYNYRRYYPDRILGTVGPYSGRVYNLDWYRYPYSYYSWRYPYTYYPYSTSLDTALALARADRVLSRSYYLPYYYRGVY